MTSLAEVYDGVGETSLRRLYLGTALFVTGACLLILGILIGTTDLLLPFDVDLFQARRIAGVLAGMGVPAVFIGIFSVLPANARERATAAIGASVAVFGVILFWQIYPAQWLGATQNHLTLPVVVVYFLGVITTFWSLFTAVVNFKTRNDPGGTVTLKRTVGGKTELVEVPVSELEGSTINQGVGKGGVGILGRIDRDAVLEEPDSNGVIGDDSAVLTESSASSGGNRGKSQVSDGGTVTQDIRSIHQAGGKTEGRMRRSDQYCGNCSFFDYVRGEESGMQPYCGFHEDDMEDMEACGHWEPNSP